MGVEGILPGRVTLRRLELQLLRALVRGLLWLKPPNSVRRGVRDVVEGWFSLLGGQKGVLSVVHWQNEFKILIE